MPHQNHGGQIKLPKTKKSHSLPKRQQMGLNTKLSIRKRGCVRRGAIETDKLIPDLTLYARKHIQAAEQIRLQ
jgi:hypothetical protein